jgi:hypothetical protein
MAKKSAARRRPAKAPARKAAGRKATARKSVGTKATARKTTARKATGGKRTARSRPSARRAPLADVRGATVRKDIGGVRLEAGQAGDGRVKRMVYPPGYAWSTHTKPHVETDYCMHAHVGFLVQGRMDVEYADGCVETYEAPQVVAVAPGHHGHVVGDEPVILIEFDFEGDTVARFGMPTEHRH